MLCALGTGWYSYTLGGKIQTSNPGFQYACNNTRHLNKTAWFLKENSPPAQIDFSRICHSCSVFENRFTSSQVPNYGIRHLILDTVILYIYLLYFWISWPMGSIVILLHQLSLVQMHQLRHWRYFYRKPVPCLENQDLWQSRNSNYFSFISQKCTNCGHSVKYFEESGQT